MNHLFIFIKMKIKRDSKSKIELTNKGQVILKHSKINETLITLIIFFLSISLNILSSLWTGWKI